jgi:hypothetical protein
MHKIIRFQKRLEMQKNRDRTAKKPQKIITVETMQEIIDF